MPEVMPKDLIEDADAAVLYAQAVRRMHRKRTKRSSSQRRTDIDVALEKLKAAMSPLRSEIGRFPYGPQTETAHRNRKRIREASASIQRERRKLFKMKPRTSTITEHDIIVP